MKSLEQRIDQYHRIRNKAWAKFMQAGGFEDSPEGDEAWAKYKPLRDAMRRMPLCQTPEWKERQIQRIQGLLENMVNPNKRASAYAISVDPEYDANCELTSAKVLNADGEVLAEFEGADAIDKSREWLDNNRPGWRAGAAGYWAT